MAITTKPFGKNAEGKDSPATCKADLQAKWRRQLASAGIRLADEVPVEIDPACMLDEASAGIVMRAAD